MIGLPELRPSSEAGVAREHQSTGSDEHRRGVRVLVHAAEGAGHILCWKSFRMSLFSFSVNHTKFNPKPKLDRQP